MSNWPHGGGFKIIPAFDLEELTAFRVISRQKYHKVVEAFDNWVIERGIQEALGRKFRENLNDCSSLILEGDEVCIRIPIGLNVIDGSYDYKQTYYLSSGETETRFFTLHIEGGIAKVKRVT